MNAKPQTLADLLIRETLRPKTRLPVLMSRPMGDLRAAVLSARKFVLDEQMSAFLADLSPAAWGAPDGGGHERCSRCPAWRTWIPKHDRGSAELGIAVHEYSVGKGEAA